MSVIERHEITSREAWLEWRRSDITASVAAAVFGNIHPYMSAYQLWAEKSGLWTPQPIDPRLARRGEVIEKIAPEIVREERPNWEITPNRLYYRDPEERIGATPDLEARRPDMEGLGAVDVKSVGAQAFRKWKDRDTGETNLPIWMAVQLNVQAALMEAAWAVVAAITIGDGGLDVEIIDVPVMPALMQKFRLLAREFWRRVREKEPYDIDWGKDAATILEMYAEDDGGGVDLTDDEEIDGILRQRADYKIVERAGEVAAKQRKLYDAQLIHKLGNATWARTKHGLVRAPTIHVKEAVRKAYTFRKISVTLSDEARETESPEPDRLAGEAQ